MCVVIRTPKLTTLTNAHRNRFLEWDKWRIFIFIFSIAAKFVCIERAHERPASPAMNNATQCRFAIVYCEVHDVRKWVDFDLFLFANIIEDKHHHHHRRCVHVHAILHVCTLQMSYQHNKKRKEETKKEKKNNSIPKRGSQNKQSSAPPTTLPMSSFSSLPPLLSSPCIVIVVVVFVVKFHRETPFMNLSDCTYTRFALYLNGLCQRCRNETFSAINCAEKKNETK